MQRGWHSEAIAWSAQYARSTKSDWISLENLIKRFVDCRDASFRQFALRVSFRAKKIVRGCAFAERQGFVTQPSANSVPSQFSYAREKPSICGRHCRVLDCISGRILDERRVGRK